MSDVKEKLISSLGYLQEAVSGNTLSDDNFISKFGWDHTSLYKYDIGAYIDNYSSKLVSINSATLDPKILKSLEQYSQQIDTLSKTIDESLEDSDGSVRVMVPNIITTLHVIFSSIDELLFNWNYIQEKKLLPRVLANRLKSVSLRIDTIETSSDDITSKIEVINDAHAAAESLPTDLKELRDTHLEIKLILELVKKEREEIAVLLSSSKAKFEKINECEADAILNKKKTDICVEQCDEALQIATTEGLAGGFDQKAKQLNKSIWLWIIGLLVALSVGAWFGYMRVGELTTALTKELTTGQAILHTVMSLFSIGGPLWLAWISTQQINQRFKLAEDYAYKATVAKSYTGFSKHAGQFDSATSERLFNSTLDRLDEMPLRLVEGKDYNSPWHEFLDSEAFKKALSMVPELANSASRFASNTKLKTKPNKSKVASLVPEEKTDELKQSENAA